VSNHALASNFAEGKELPSDLPVAKQALSSEMKGAGLNLCELLKWIRALDQHGSEDEQPHFGPRTPLAICGRITKT